MQKELSKRIRELAIVGECLIPLQLVWIVLFLHPSMIIPLIFKILVLCISLGMAIGCNKEREFGIKCAYILEWLELIVSSIILLFWISDRIIYVFGIADIVFCIALYIDLRKIKKLKNEK